MVKFIPSSTADICRQRYYKMSLTLYLKSRPNRFSFSAW